MSHHAAPAIGLGPARRDDDDDGAAALRANWIGYLAICLGMFMAILDIQIVASSLPEIRAGLNIPLDKLGWVQTAYLMAEIVVIPLTGWFTRLLSLRGLFLAAVVGFTAASLGCAASANFATLLAFRAIQGCCGGAMIPCAFTAVFGLFPAALHLRAMTIAGALAMLAPTLGPTLGGYVTEEYRWPWLFLINLGPGSLAAATAATSAPSGLSPAFGALPVARVPSSPRGAAGA